MKFSWAIYLASLFLLKFIDANVKQYENKDVHFLYKRKELPDLNGPPPIESDHEEEPFHQVQTVQANEKYTKKRKSILDSTGCVHNSNCVHWNDLPVSLRRKFRTYNWRKELPEEVRKEMSREQSKRWHSKLTPQEKQRRKEMLEKNRQRRLQEMPPEKREKYLAQKNKISKAHYQRNKVSIANYKRLKYHKDKEKAKSHIQQPEQN